MDKIIQDFKKARDNDNLMEPHNCGAGYIYSDMGVDIEEEHEFQEELHGIVDKMKDDLVNETKILEGTVFPVYCENELSSNESKEEQWRTDLLNGSSTTDLTPISSEDSNTSFSSVSSLNRARVIHDYDEKYPQQPTVLCVEMSEDCGPVIEHLNESFDSTVQMINVPMLGMQNEEK